MLCQCCSRNQATTCIQTVVEGELKKYFLCPSCAQKMGYGKLFGINPGALLGSLLRQSNEESPAGVTTCPDCGTDFAEIVRTGRVGCAHCYEVFCDQLMPVIQRIHGNTVHSGKRPAGAAAREEERAESADVLKAELQKAVEEQEFERAAELRDRIRELERQEKAHE